MANLERLATHSLYEDTIHDELKDHEVNQLLYGASDNLWMKPLTPSDLGDLSSETETPSEGESDVEFVVESDTTSDPPSESAEETEDPV